MLSVSKSYINPPLNPAAYNQLAGGVVAVAVVYDFIFFKAAWKSIHQLIRPRITIDANIKNQDYGYGKRERRGIWQE